MDAITPQITSRKGMPGLYAFMLAELEGLVLLFLIPANKGECQKHLLIEIPQTMSDAQESALA